MKLSEALVLRADLQKRLEQLRERLTLSVLVQEGETPPEDATVLLTELDTMLAQLTSLIARINRTNLSAQLSDGTPVTVALAQRDTLKLKISVLRTVAEVASNRGSRYSRSEIRSVATIEVAQIRQQLDDLARNYRELDTAIQATNWTTELLE